MIYRGEKYTEGDTDTNLTGFIMMGESSDVVKPIQVNTLADDTANPTVPGVGSFMMGYDGSTWDRVKGDSTDGLLVNLGANNDVDVVSSALPTGAATETTLDACKTALQIIDNFISGTKGLVTEDNSNAIKTALELIDNMISGSEAQVDVITLPALPAGTNAVGKLLPPNIDVTTHTNYIRKYYTSAGAVTDGIIWSPAAGTRWHVVTMYINVSAAATVTLEDDKTGGDDPVWKGEIAANSGVVIPFTEMYPMASGEDAADLLITTSAGNVYVTVVGYEI